MRPRDGVQHDLCSFQYFLKASERQHTKVPSLAAVMITDGKTRSSVFVLGQTMRSISKWGLP